MPTVADLDPLAAELLAAMRRRLAGLVETDLFKLPSDRMAAGRIRAAVAAAKQGVLRIDLDAWLGHVPRDAERRAAHRALDRLEETGWVRRLRFGYDGQRATHIELLRGYPASH